MEPQITIVFTIRHKGKHGWAGRFNATVWLQFKSQTLAKPKRNLLQIEPVLLLKELRQTPLSSEALSQSQAERCEHTLLPVGKRSSEGQGPEWREVLGSEPWFSQDFGPVTCSPGQRASVDRCLPSHHFTFYSSTLFRGL